MILLLVKNNFKKHKDKIIDPLIFYLNKLGFTADVLTLISLACGLAAVYFLYKNHVLFVILIVFHFIFDILDGSLARLQKKSLPKGVFFDYTVDRIVTAALFIKACFYYDIFYWNLGLYVSLHLFFIFLFLRKDSEYIKKFFFLEGLMIGSFIFKLECLVVLPFIILDYLINAFTLSRKE